MLKRHTTRLEAHTETALTPLQVAKAYNFPLGLNVSKRTVAIVELGGAYNLKDVVTYCNRYGYKVPHLTNVLVDGATLQSDPNGADGEVCLDIDVIAAVAQGCHIIVVFAPNTNTGFTDGIAKALSFNPDAISISWGGPETSFADSDRAAMDALFKEAEEKGINVFCAAGDNGSNDGTNSPVCDYPASSPYVIACGGTTLQLNSDGTRASETAWSTGLFNSSGTGGGISGVYTTTPDWQSGLLPNEPAGRREPDVSGNANPNTGYLVDIDGNIAQIGGTSAVAPLYAALQVSLNAKADKHVGNLHTKIYADPNMFTKIESGTNGAYSCNADGSYSVVCGLGVLDGSKQTLA